MIISKMIFNKSAAFKEIFAGGYALHQTVWDLFGDNPDRRRDFLYRLDFVGRVPLVYTVSSRAPNNAKGLWRIESKDYAPRLETGMKIGFSVRINPTIKRDGKRHDVVMDAKYKARANDSNREVSIQELIADLCGRWFEKRAQQNGFKILQFRADGYQQIRFNKAKGGKPVRYSIVDITGALEVIDQKLFGNVLFEGVGPEKGFGCGLMLVRKI
ncbi:MAG: type I-E CRISPR-associated protein Cas6/Cse3/CasE [Candidatus Omnitrophica bacterium]|nr:type I-E CRISPR-associated protein Cas6/Cse3/CasE [Candidatus Omnitrophota bacterium]MBU4479219.1 type I-E CRISPR-associated protein Cas6/Cse3/CasE [Candidatus Omnitrophota bacterium]